jgi:hypothetical protein
MGRLIFKSFVVVLLALGIGNYLVYLKTGHTPLRDMRERLGDDWLVDLRELFSPNQLAADAKQVVKGIADKYSEPQPAASTRVYKWTDADGQVHFGDKPLASDAKQIEVDVRNAISAPDDKAGKTVTPVATNQQSVSESALDKARAAAEAMRQHVQQQEQVQ